MNKYKIDTTDGIMHIINIVNSLNATNVKNDIEFGDGSKKRIEIRDFNGLNYIFYPNHIGVYVFEASYVHCEFKNTIERL